MFELILNWVYRQFPDSSTDDAFALAQRMYSIVELHDSYWYTQPMWRIYDQTKTRCSETRLI